MAGNFWQSSHWEQWIVEKAELLRGRAEDLKIYTEEEYQKLMIFFCNFIQSVASEPQVWNNNTRARMQVIATACVYFRRFYAKRSLKDIDPFLLAPTCIFLATKVEEHGNISTSKLMSVVSTALKKLPYAFQDLPLRVSFIQDAEFILLEILDCCLVVYQPYRPLKQMLNDLKELPNAVKDFGEIESNAMRICNDSLRTDACMLYAPHIIAMGCIQTTVIILNREKEFVSWFADYTVEFDKVLEVVQLLFSMFKIYKQIEDKEHLKHLLEKLPKVNPNPPPYHGMMMPQ